MNIIIEYNILSSCCICSSSLNSLILFYSRSQRCAILFLLFSFFTHLYNTSRALLFFSLIAKLSSEFTVALSCSFANALFILRDNNHTSCKHDEKLLNCFLTFTFNSAENSQSRDELLRSMSTIRRRVWRLC